MRMPSARKKYKFTSIKMKLYTNAGVKIVEHNNFQDEQGRPVDYYTVYLKNEDGEVLEVNSGTDFTNMEGETGIACINATKRATGGGFKLSLKDFKKNDSLDTPDDTIV